MSSKCLVSLMYYNLQKANIFFLLLALFANTAFAIGTENNEINLLALKTKLGNSVNLALEFKDSSGKLIKLSDFAEEKKPIIFIPGYYTCPRLCGLLFDGVSDLLLKLSLKPGQDFRLVSVSFNQNEKQESASKFQEKYNSKIGSVNSDWHFIYPQSTESLQLFQQLGFPYLNDGSGDFAHSAALFILTPSGEISQYFTGVDFDPFSVKLALIEASKGSIGTLIDHALLFCFRFDTTKGKYTWVVGSSLKIGGLLTILLLGSFLGRLWLKERRV